MGDTRGGDTMPAVRPDEDGGWRELNRLDLRGERTAEHPFDEVLYPLFKVA